MVTVGVMKSKRKGSRPFWIGYPGRKPEGGGRYINQFVVTNRKLKNILEKSIIRKYERAVSEEGDVEEY